MRRDILSTTQISVGSEVNVKDIPSLLDSEISMNNLASAHAHSLILA